MKLSALTDFPDDARKTYTKRTMDLMMKRLKQTGVSRVCFQYYGNKEYGFFWDHDAPVSRDTVKTAELMPNHSREYVKAAKKYNMETVSVMRPQEQGIWITYSPYYPEYENGRGVNCIDGKMLITTKFLQENPHLRVKRRSWDVDQSAVNKTVYSIKLKKQNDIHSRIQKENIIIYTSSDNSNYKKYEGIFDISFSYETAEKDVVVSMFAKDYPTTTITKAGDRVESVIISGLDISEKFLVVGVKCSGLADETVGFKNTPINMISIYDEQGTEICATPGSTVRDTPTGDPHLLAGFNFDDGFGHIFETILDPSDEEGFIAICKGKSEYAHGTLCACEPKVREYWYEWLEKAMDDGYDLVGQRIECHSMHVDEPYAYGYNDCIKEEYEKRFGHCDEKDMDLKKIAQIRGDAYTEYFTECARRIRARGKKVILNLNVEMLYDPIPAVRQMAYPLNVEWQWEKWISNMEPDEINIRSYQMSPEFIFEDSQCKKILEKAKSYGVPLTLERYVYWDFAAEFEMVRDLGVFSRMTLYEVNDVIKSDGKGGIVVEKPELLARLKELTKEQ
ncbi:MAG: hypothetical protein J7L77_01055 [Clostridiales bacterium]|nr:hypothetical protein [Clostridiales bacterium]